VKELESKKSRKEMYERLFNEIFGTSIKWSKLSIEELTQLATILANPELLIKKLGGIPASEAASTSFVELIKKLMSEYEGPLVKLFKKYMFGEERNEKKYCAER